MKFSHVLLLSASLLSFQAQAMDPYDIVEMVYDNSIIYSRGIFKHHQNGSTLSTEARPPQKAAPQSVLFYEKDFQNYTKELVLRKSVPGEDGRKHITNTTLWPYSIHTQLSMVFNEKNYGGSASMIGPHHLLTCGHCVYDFDQKVFFQKISAVPACNGSIAPFGELKVTKAYIFKRWKEQGDEKFDIAVLLLERSIGDYTGWGGLLSTTDSELSQKKVDITGYPGDKPPHQLWSMGDKIKTIMPEQFKYEIDTAAGQSGSAIWITNDDSPLIIGVHTLGADFSVYPDFKPSLFRDIPSQTIADIFYDDYKKHGTPNYKKLVNSGVRISGNKLTNFLIKIISDTYTISSVFPSPIIDLSVLEKRQKAFVIRASGIDECIKQYKLLNSSGLTFLDLMNSLNMVVGLYIERTSYAELLNDYDMSKILHPFMSPRDIEVGLNGIQTCIDLRLLTKDAVVCNHRTVSKEIMAFYKRCKENIKVDLIESMRLYNELYSKPHPRWNELNTKTKKRETSSDEGEEAGDDWGEEAGDDCNIM